MYIYMYIAIKPENHRKALHPRVITFGALIIRKGFGDHYIIIILKNPLSQTVYVTIPLSAAPLLAGPGPGTRTRRTSRRRKARHLKGGLGSRIIGHWGLGCLKPFLVCLSSGSWGLAAFWFSVRRVRVSQHLGLLHGFWWRLRRG